MNITAERALFTKGLTIIANSYRQNNLSQGSLDETVVADTLRMCRETVSAMESVVTWDVSPTPRGYKISCASGLSDCGALRRLGS